MSSYPNLYVTIQFHDFVVFKLCIFQDLIATFVENHSPAILHSKLILEIFMKMLGLFSHVPPAINFAKVRVLWKCITVVITEINIRIYFCHTNHIPTTFLILFLFSENTILLDGEQLYECEHCGKVKLFFLKHFLIFLIFFSLRFIHQIENLIGKDTYKLFTQRMKDYPAIYAKRYFILFILSSIIIIKVGISWYFFYVTYYEI